MLQVKLFDYEHEMDLERNVNLFLERLPDNQIIDIKYTIAAMNEPIDDEQIYCYSAMVMYRK